MEGDKEKNICFITLGNLYLCPYLSTYLGVSKHRTTIIYWNRENKDEIRNDGNQYIAFATSPKYTKGVLKIIGYIQFRKFVKQKLLTNHFSGIVLLQTLAALLLSNILIKYFPEKYIVDIRDYSYENLLFVRLLEKRVLKKSFRNIISSEGFRNFLPEGKYLIVHNTRSFNSLAGKAYGITDDARMIHIAYIGYVRYIEQFKKLLHHLKNDERFLISFIGTKALELQDFCCENNIKNVILQDTFDDKDILNLYKDVDIVNNLYGNHTPVLDYALSNKLYLAAELHKPILVCPDTYMETIVSQYGIGYIVDLDSSSSIGDGIYNYYKNIDWSLFSNKCNEFNCKVKEEQSMFIEEIDKFIN